MLWVLGTGIPVCLAVIALSVDIYRIQVVSDQIRYVADNAASAAAWQQVVGETVLDEEAAGTAAQEVYCRALIHLPGQAAAVSADGPMPTREWCPESTPDGEIPERVALEVSFGDYYAGTDPRYSLEGHRSVTVTAHYQVTGLTVLPIFQMDGGSIAGSTIDMRPLSRTASVCIPGAEDGATGGHCARPITD